MSLWLKILLFFGLICLLSALLAAGAEAAPAAQGEIPAEEEETPQPPSDGQLINQALQDRLAQYQGEAPLLVFFDLKIDRIEYNADQTEALVWLAKVDRQSGEVAASEPAVAVARKYFDESGQAAWTITLPFEDQWQVELEQAPEELLSAEARDFLTPSTEVRPQAGTVYRGYRLPWTRGVTMRLTGSISHFLGYKSCDIENCRYAYDFADGTMFDLMAAKAGTVDRFYDSCPNYSEVCSNYLVIKDTTTSPTTYQLYLHLAYNSIPAKLKTKGAPVQQGEFIGKADDTGYSTGHHLHFHVHTNPYSYWGASVDIRFDEVTINGGAPRNCYEASKWPEYGTECSNEYKSENTADLIPPTGGLNTPANKAEINGSALAVSGWGKDNRAVKEMQVRAFFNGGWQPVGQPFTGSSFSATIDLCAAGVPSGPLTLGLEVSDYSGNSSGIVGKRDIIVNSNCPPTPPPACIPAANEISIFASPFYEGTCQIYPADNTTKVIDYPYAVGPNDAESILVGSNARALIFDLFSGKGRSDLFSASDPQMADNRLMVARPDSIKVQLRSTAPGGPGLLPPGSLPGLNPQSVDSLVFSWNMNSMASEYSAELTGPNNIKKTLGYQKDTFWSVGNLAPGDYTLRVTGKNEGGSGSTTMQFKVEPGELPAADPSGLPYLADFEGESNRWFAQAGSLWYLQDLDLGGRVTRAWVFNNPETNHYQITIDNNGTPMDVRAAGDLTSEPILISAPGQVLTFAYYFRTERFQNYPASRYWDQRRLQISVDGGPFTDVLQLQDDPMETWLNSPPVNLTPYAGKTIRLRFHFNSLDEYYNSSGSTWFGWAVDDVAIQPEGPPPACNEPKTNNTTASATALNLGSAAEGDICPAGDLDFYRFSASAGQFLIVELEDAAIGSPLESTLTILDSSGGQLYYQTGPNPRKEFRAPYSGTYYVKVRSARHPSQAGAEMDYRLRIREDRPPSFKWISPIQKRLPWVIPFQVAVNASDAETSVVRMDLWWHSGDWTNGQWQPLGSDTNGADGWSIPVLASAVGLTPDSAIFVQVTDTRGSKWGSAMWGLSPDSTPPESLLSPLPASSGSTLIPLEWSLLSGGEDLDHFILKYKDNGSAWQTLETSLPAGQRAYRFWGQPGHSYQFCLQAVDNLSNVEPCPDAPEAWTNVASGCAPDGWESADNTPAGAVLLGLGEPQVHALCPLGDVDWVRVNLSAGEAYFVDVWPQGGYAAVTIGVYKADNLSERIDEARAGDLGRATAWYLKPAETGSYYLKIEPLDPRLTGSEVRYLVRLSTGIPFYLPLASP